MNDKAKQDEQEMESMTKVKEVSNKIVKSECKSLNQEIIEFQSSAVISNSHDKISYSREAQVCAERTIANTITKDFLLTTSHMWKFASSVTYGYETGFSSSFSASSSTEGGHDFDISIPSATVQDEIVASMA